MSLGTLEEYGSCQGYSMEGDNPPHKGDASRRSERCDIRKPALKEDVFARVFFVRHAESTWNERGVWKTIKHKIWTAPRRFFDAHLSEEGIAGAMELRDWIFSGECLTADQCFLRGTPYEDDQMRRVVFATSNLRRAILTALIAFHGRLDGTSEERLKIKHMYILSSLQETASNVDSTTVTPPNEIPYLTFSKSQCPFKLSSMDRLFITECSEEDNRQHRLSGKGLERFCDWMRDMAIDGLPTTDAHPAALREDGVTDFVLTGHSIWLREFFQKYLEGGGKNSLDKDIASSTMKVANQSVVKFTVKFPMTGSCVIQSNTSELLHGELKKRYWLVR
jgi:hypothetical protein